MVGGTFEVTLVEARSLKNTDFIAKMNPCVVIQYGNQKNPSAIAKDQQQAMYVKDVIASGTEKGKTELGVAKYRVVLQDKTYAGEISVALAFTLNS